MLGVCSGLLSMVQIPNGSTFLSTKVRGELDALIIQVMDPLAIQLSSWTIHEYTHFYHRNWQMSVLLYRLYMILPVANFVWVHQGTKHHSKSVHYNNHHHKLHQLLPTVDCWFYNQDKQLHDQLYEAGLVLQQNTKVE